MTNTQSLVDALRDWNSLPPIPTRTPRTATPDSSEEQKDAAWRGLERSEALRRQYQRALRELYMSTDALVYEDTVQAIMPSELTLHGFGSSAEPSDTEEIEDPKRLAHYNLLTVLHHDVLMQDNYSTLSIEECKTLGNALAAASRQYLRALTPAAQLATTANPA